MNDFRFLRFAIRQDRCAMKVGTDGVLLGAWARLDGCRRVLDVGSGTGLVALMAAQRLEGLPGAGEWTVTGVELDGEAASQAGEYVAASPWASRVTVCRADVREWSPDTPFDTLLCNPPFFTRSLRCPDDGRATARHDDTLSLDDLAQAASRLLSRPEGTLQVVIPADRRTDMVAAAAGAGLYAVRETQVSTTPAKAPKRLLMRFAFTAAPLERDTLVIADKDGIYTPAFTALVKGFYLYV